MILTKFINLNLKVSLFINFFKETKGDAMFSHINSIPRSDGTILGTKLNTYTNHVNRYNLSKGLVSEAQLLERSWVRNFSNFLLSKIYRYRYNYLFKGTVVVGIYSTFMSLSHYGIDFIY